MKKDYSDPLFELTKFSFQAVLTEVSGSESEDDVKNKGDDDVVVGG